jgi:hypothetical protein
MGSLVVIVTSAWKTPTEWMGQGNLRGDDYLTLILGVDLHELGVKLIDELGTNSVDKGTFG